MEKLKLQQMQRPSVGRMPKWQTAQPQATVARNERSREQQQEIKLERRPEDGGPTDGKSLEC